MEDCSPDVACCDLNSVSFGDEYMEKSEYLYLFNWFCDVLALSLTLYIALSSRKGIYFVEDETSKLIFTWGVGGLMSVKGAIVLVWKIRLWRLDQKSKTEEDSNNYKKSKLYKEANSGSQQTEDKPKTKDMEWTDGLEIGWSSSFTVYYWIACIALIGAKDTTLFINLNLVKLGSDILLLIFSLVVECIPKKKEERKKKLTEKEKEKKKKKKKQEKNQFKRIAFRFIKDLFIEVQLFMFKIFENDPNYFGKDVWPFLPAYIAFGCLAAYLLCQFLIFDLFFQIWYQKEMTVSEKCGFFWITIADLLVAVDLVLLTFALWTQYFGQVKSLRDEGIRILGGLAGGALLEYVVKKIIYTIILKKKLEQERIEQEEQRKEQEEQERKEQEIQNRLEPALLHTEN